MSGGHMEVIARLRLLYARRGYRGLARNSRVSIHLSRVSHPCVRLVHDRDMQSRRMSDVQRAGQRGAARCVLCAALVS